MQELVFEIPLKITESDFPIELLKHAQILHMLRFDSVGYMFVCKMLAQKWSEYEKNPSLSSRSTSPSRGKISARVLSRESKSGAVVLQVSGRWIEEGRKLNDRELREFDFFRSIEKAPHYVLQNPVISGQAISFKFAADGKQIRQLLSGLDELKIPHKVKKLGRIGTKAQSMLNDLTWQQARVLKLAHTMGYYDIPRRTNTEELAKMLKMNKATVGEHLRRAEKHVFDKLVEES